MPMLYHISSCKTSQELNGPFTPLKPSHRSSAHTEGDADSEPSIDLRA